MLYQQSPSWDAFIQACRGAPDISPSVTSTDHTATTFLDNIRLSGVPLHIDAPPWTPDDKTAAITRGSHPSARLHLEFLRNELADMIDQKFWIALPYETIKHLDTLCLSPMGVVPQLDRRPRVIVDYTFSQVNHHTARIAPTEAMQFGHALDRLLMKIHYANPSYGPVYLSKTDLADGFYRIPLASDSIPALAVAFPHTSPEPAIVALPLALPMGWVNSPPYFCAFTESIADITNTQLHQSRHTRHLPQPEHRLSFIADHPDNEPPLPLPSCQLPMWSRPPFLPRPTLTPLAYVDIYVDDFIALGQGDTTTLHNVRTTLFNTIDSVFRPLDLTDNQPSRKEPISVKKLHKGDARWTTRKPILGWIIDTVAATIELPPHRADRLHHILQTLLQRRRVSLNSWQKMVGELRSMVLALPGGRGLFSTLYTCFADRPTDSRVRISKPIRDALRDLHTLALDLQHRPTRIGEIVDTLPVAYGTADASGLGMGGIWLSPDPAFTPILWRMAFPPSVLSRLITAEHPTGTITNSDLELAGQIGTQDILAQQYDCRERTIAVFTDNMAARAWQRKGSHTTLGPSAYLLRLLSLHTRHYRYRPTFDYLPGPVNVMADDASRLFHLSDDQLLTHFHLHYPQNKPWVMLTLRPEMLSALTSALLCKRSPPALYLPDPVPAQLPGFAGPPIVAFSASIPPAATSGIHFSSSKHLPKVTATAQSRPVVSLYDLAPWKAPSGPSARRWPSWGPLTPASTLMDNPTMSSNNNSGAMPDSIHQPPE